MLIHSTNFINNTYFNKIQVTSTHHTTPFQLLKSITDAYNFANEELQEAAKANTIENFFLVFDKMLERLFVERLDGNEEIFMRLMNDDEFRAIASKYLMKEVYGTQCLHTHINAEVKYICTSI